MTKEEILKILNALKDKMNKEEYEAVLSFLYPEDYPPNEATKKIIQEMKEKGKRHFRVERKKNEIIIEIWFQELTLQG